MPIYISYQEKLVVSTFLLPLDTDGDIAMQTDEL